MQFAEHLLMVRQIISVECTQHSLLLALDNAVCQHSDR